MGMEGPVARWYQKTTGRDLQPFRETAERLKVCLTNGGSVLEIAPGPGFRAIELARDPKFRVTGLDISRTFVELARKNAAQASVPVDFRQGNASDMPFATSSFDLLVCRAAFKNFSQPVRALQEMYRVLAPGGRALIIDLRRDASQESISEAINGMDLGGVNKIITKLTFRFMLLKRAYTRSEFEEFLSQTKFRPIDIKEELIGLELSLERALTT